MYFWQSAYRKDTGKRAPPGLAFAAALVVAGFVLEVGASEPIEMELRDSVQQQFTLAAGQVEEPCVDLRAGERLDYRYEASAAVDFNLHYHEAAEAVFPINQNQQLSDSGQYFVAKSRNYCLMWTNRGSQSVDIQYSYSVYQEGQL
jgi:hypothetical protein